MKHDDTMTSSRPHRGTIFVEEAEILDHQAFDGDQYILRVQAPRCAEKAQPGSFAHIQCGPSRPLRRPISIMRTSPQQGWVEFLYKAVGEGTRLLATRRAGERISMMGPIGVPFRLNPERPRPLLIGGGVGMPPMIFIAQTWPGTRTGSRWSYSARKSLSRLNRNPPPSWCPACRTG